MTHDTHTPGSSRPTGRRHPRPDLGRPSLFADFDQASVEDIEPQRIRLLSTLESQRGVRARPRGRRLPTGRNRVWLTRTLMVMMGLGMLVMLLSFIQLLRRPPPSMQIPQAMVTNATAARPVDRVGGVHGTADLTTPIQAAEIIDMSPPGAGSARSAVIASTQPASPGSIEVSASMGSSAHSAIAAPAAASTSQPTPQPAPHSTAQPHRAETLTDAPRRAVASTTTGPERVNRKAHTGALRQDAKQETGASHEDVALVEAMLAHAGPRKAPPSPTAALQRCGAGNSPEAAVCRARICVQHPSLPACHAP